MDSEKFTNTSITIKGLLGLIEAKDIAIPEIQRPFVWKNSQVRDLIDSLYKGYPTGYIILWKNPNVKLMKNLEMNCIPTDVFDMDFQDYPRFLEGRRLLMANKIRKYYENL